MSEVVSIATAAEVIRFWSEAGPDRWFTKDEAFDADIRRRFLATHEAAAEGKLATWEQSAEGALALMILLDQFPRNMFRNDPRAFSTDALARTIASRAIAEGRDQRIETGLRAFIYLPFEHSEDMADQERSIELFAPLGADSLKWAVLHADIIRKFGRFPHRNTVLGRTTTPEEAAFLKDGGFSG